MTTLLEKAKKAERKIYIRAGRKDVYSDEGIDLILAFMNNEITNRQLSEALGVKVQPYNMCTPVLRWAIQEGKIEIIKQS